MELLTTAAFCLAVVRRELFGECSKGATIVEKGHLPPGENSYARGRGTIDENKAKRGSVSISPELWGSAVVAAAKPYGKPAGSRRYMAAQSLIQNGPLPEKK